MARARVMPKQGIRPESDSFAKSQLALAVDQQRRDQNSLPFNRGVWLRDVVVPAAASVTVAHNLGHVPSGYIITKMIGGYQVFLFTQSALTATQISWVNSGAGAVTIDAWVF
jgi:hypothetical protein